ncbi:MAG TPA: hypothetical protein VM935_16805, partial [Chitinophagaceae bacterium]|nr:hypothetical protein [Chitinophagaceae bacterium]
MNSIKYKLFKTLLYAGGIIGFGLSSPITHSQTISFHITTPINRQGELGISEYHWVKNTFSILSQQNVPKQGKLILTLQLDSARKLSLGNSKVFVEFEKDVFLTLDTNMMISEVKSKYPGNYTLYPKLELRHEEQKLASLKSITEKKDYSKKILEERLKIIERAFEENTISKAFYNYIKTDYEYAYLSQLFRYYTDHKDSLSLPESFLAEFTPDRFTDDKNLNSMFYAFALDDYTTYISNVKYAYTLEVYNNRSSAIEKNFKGRQKEFLHAYLFRNFSKRQKPEYANALKETYPKLIELVKT